MHVLTGSLLLLKPNRKSSGGEELEHITRELTERRRVGLARHAEARSAAGCRHGMGAWLTLAALLAATGAAHAGPLAPGGAETVELGRFIGIAYYMEELGGFRVVATLAEGETGLPLRVEATLADSQSITISVPGGLGRARQSVQLSRQGDQLVLSRPQGDLSN
jgi:hypothetical protein